MPSLNFQTHDKKFYSIGKANIFFKPEGAEAYRLLGDSDTCEIEIAVSEEDRFSNECGLRNKVQTVVTELEATLTLELAHIVDVNRALSLLGTASNFTQSAQVGVVDTFTDGAANLLDVCDLSEKFIDSITSVTDTGANDTYVEGTHYLLDALGGSIQIIDKPAGIANDDIVVTYDTLAIVADDGKSRVGIGAQSDNTGSIIIRQCQDFGPNLRVFLPRVQLRPDGARSYVSETDFDIISLTGTILADSTQEAGFELGEELFLTDPV